jgi:hypothetical protein
MLLPLRGTSRTACGIWCSLGVPGSGALPPWVLSGIFCPHPPWAFRSCRRPGSASNFRVFFHRLSGPLSWRPSKRILTRCSPLLHRPRSFRPAALLRCLIGLWGHPSSSSGAPRIRTTLGCSLCARGIDALRGVANGIRTATHTLRLPFFRDPNPTPTAP